MSTKSAFSDVLGLHDCCVTCSLVTKLNVLRDFGFRLGDA